MTNTIVWSKENRSRQQLDSLEIHNFRAFRSLKIEKLGNVNLIVDKNSVGKSALLEALRLYSTQGSPKTIGDILQEREEWSPRLNSVEEAADTVVPVNNLFYGRHSIAQNNTIIQIGPPDFRATHFRLKLVGVYAKSTAKGRDLGFVLRYLPSLTQIHSLTMRWTRSNHA